MIDNTKTSRRQFLKVGAAALAMIPVVTLSRNALAAKNDGTRTALKYQDKPEGDKKCVNCVQFVPGKTPKDKGGCKAIPNDTEISPDGYCMAYAKK